ncbi:MAG: methionyl-tRNA formyltransferase [Pseudomonadota bacterium]
MSKPLNIVYAGTPDFAAVALQALIESRHNVVAVYTQPDRPAGRGRKLKAGPVKTLAQKHGIEVHQPESLKSPEEQAILAELKPDVMVVAAYGLILPEAVLNIPPMGCLNIHASLLPRWRGAAPIQRAILAGDKETGVTIMQMDEGLDTGDMLYTLSTAITADDTAATLHDRLAELGGKAILEALDALQSGGLTAQKQEDSQACYAKKLHKSEASIDWDQPATRIAAQVAAFNPWPVAQTAYQGDTLRLWEARAIDESTDRPPGSVIRAGKQGIDIAAGEGVLRILRLQRPGGKPQTAADFINANNLDGVILGG